MSEQSMRLAMKHRTRGVTLVEYLVLVGSIAIVVLLGYRALRTPHDKATAQAGCVAALSCGEGQPGGAYPLMAATSAGEGAQGVGQGAKRQPSPWERTKDLLYGFFVDGFVGLFTGTWDMVTQPVATAQGLWFLVSRPQEALPAMWQEMNDASEENFDRFVGNVLFEVATLALPPLKIAKLAKLKNVVKVRRARAVAAGSRWAGKFGWQHVNAFSGEGRMINCARCVQAVDACLEGANACARPMNDPLGVPTNVRGNAVDLIDLTVLADRLGLNPASWKTVANAAALEAEALSWGNNTKGIVYVAWRDASGRAYGHVFNVVVVDGKVLYIDGQTGQVANQVLISQAYNIQVIRSRDMPPGTLP
jgi:hypothetical protein